MAVNLFGVIVRSFSGLALGIVTGPGLLVEGLLGRRIHQGCMVWLIGAIGQYLIIYAISLIANRRPILWGLRLGLLVLAWLGSGYLGWLMVG